MPPKATGLNAREPKHPNVFTVRPLPAPITHKTFLRTSLHRRSLAPLNLKSGELCQLSACHDNGPVKWWPAVAWLALDPQLQRETVLVSDAIRDVLGVGFEDKVVMRRYQGKVRTAEMVVVREIPSAGTPMREEERGGWRFFMEHILFEAKYVFEGVVFTDVQYKGRNRSFRVETITAVEETLSTSPGETKPDASLNPVVPAHTVAASTTTKLLEETIPEPAKTTTDGEKAAAITKSDEEKRKVPTQAPTKALKFTSVQPPVLATQPSNITFSSIGGLDSQINSLQSLLLSVFQDADEFAQRGLVPPRGVLLYGPAGTGKTMMMRAAATAFGSSTKSYVIDGKVMGKYQGESEDAIRKIFAAALQNQPSIIFMDEVDALAPKRSQRNGEGTEGRVVATLLTEMDALESAAADGSIARVAFVAATNRPNSIDESLRRSGRFEKELEIGIPDANARRDILTLLTRKLDFESKSGSTKEEIVAALAARTHGYVGADLEAVVRGAFTSGLERRRKVTPGLPPTRALTTEAATPAGAAGSLTPIDASPEKKGIIISDHDLEAAMKQVKPTAMREIFIEPPKVRWSDIGGQEEVKQRLREAVEWPLTHPEVFTRLGGTPRKGLLLYGPPGCSKTLTAKALATEAGLNFMAIKGPELLSMYVGESERAVREVFRKARAASPSIIFFDEIDALTASREGPRGGGGGVNVLTALLNEMDGIEALKNVVVLAATNRPEIIDLALMRPGRLDTILYVGPPDLDARLEILKIKVKKMAVAPDVDLRELAQKLDGFSGAEIVNICDEAIHYAMRESFDIAAVERKHFVSALEKAVPQITAMMRRRYEEWSVGGVKKI